MLQYTTIIRRLARMKAASELSGSFGNISAEVQMAAMIYGKKPETIRRAVSTIYPQVFKTMAEEAINMLTIQEVNRAIMLQTWTNTELSSMIDAVKWNREQLNKRIRRSIGVGDNVEFTSTKTGRLTRGFVTKVAIKYVTVNTGMGLWRVPANMLSVVDKELA